MLDLSNLYQRIARLDRRLYERADAWLAQHERIPRSRLFRLLSLLVAAYAAQPAATALYLRHWNDAWGILSGILFLVSFALLSWIRERELVADSPS